MAPREDAREAASHVSSRLRVIRQDAISRRASPRFGISAPALVNLPLSLPVARHDETSNEVGWSSMHPHVRALRERRCEMLHVGKEDSFERAYTQKFRVIAGRYGEFLGYERDRAASDLGLQFTRRLSSGSELMTPTLVWFQLKGLHASTLTRENFGKAKEVKLPIAVRHLRYWYLQPVPTYLAVYVESMETNQQGQFLFCEAATGVPLARRMAEFLVSEYSRIARL